MISACAILTWDLQRSGAITSWDFAVTLFLVWHLKQDLQWSGAITSRDFADHEDHLAGFCGILLLAYFWCGILNCPGKSIYY